MKINDINSVSNSLNNNIKLPKFDIFEFKNLNLDPDAKELLNIMAKYLKILRFFNKI
jgi:hypothetical protein